jgi:hypothetical protein
MSNTSSSKKSPLTDSQKAIFRRLTTEFGLNKDHFFLSPQGFVTVTRPAIDLIASKMNISITFLPVPEFSSVSEDKYVVKCRGDVQVGDGEGGTFYRYVEMFGESSRDNCRGGAKMYPVAMAQKRAYSRVVLMLAQLYQESVFGEDEILPEVKEGSSFKSEIGYEKK